MTVIPKPEPYRKVKARRKRRERALVIDVRAHCVRRDGYCRLRGVPGFEPCSGDSQWSHLGDKKRWRTRGMQPEERHTPEGSLMMCDGHHDRYDGQARPRIEIEELGPDGAEGLLEFRTLDGQIVYREEESA